MVSLGLIENVDKPTDWVNSIVIVDRRFKFKRLPFGVHCASEVFSKRISEILDGLDRVAYIQDDIIVWGTDQENNDKRIKESGLKLNKKKCEFGLREIKKGGSLLVEKYLLETYA
jgi:hypothetical protein